MLPRRPPSIGTTDYSSTAKRRAKRRTERSGRADAHRRAHLGEDRRGDRARLLRAGAQDLLQAVLVRAQLLVALAHGREVLDDRLRDGALEVAVAGALEFLLDVVGRDATGDGEDV